MNDNENGRWYKLVGVRGESKKKIMVSHNNYLLTLLRIREEREREKDDDKGRVLKKCKCGWKLKFRIKWEGKRHSNLSWMV